MGKTNCREVNMCMFCKYWLGRRPEVDSCTGNTKYKVEESLCKMDSTNGKHRSDSLCHQFEKCLMYM